MSNGIRAYHHQLTAENRRSLRRMEQYLDSYSLNEVAYEELLSDLAGMALECQERGESFANAVGMDEVTFCRELVVNCPRETFGERVLGLLRRLIAWLGAVLPVMVLLECIFPWMPGRCDGLLYTVPASFLCKYCTAILLIVAGLYFAKRNIFRSKYQIGMVFGAVFLAVFITVSEVCAYAIGEVEWQISLGLWIAVFAVLLLLCIVAKRCLALTLAYQQKQRLLKSKERDEQKW